MTALSITTHESLAVLARSEISGVITPITRKIDFLRFDVAVL